MRHRLVQFERGVLDTQTPAITTPSSDPVLPNAQSWLGSGGENLLDRRGNWTGFSSQINTSLAEQERELDTTDKQNAGVNEYDRSMTRIGNQWVYEEFTYDDNGNLIAIDMVGDVNCDGVTDFADNNVFILLLTDPQQYALDYPDCSGELGDVNNNGSVGFDDINGFVDLLTNLGDGEARRYDYDDENRLIAVKEYDGTLITEYAYDALGRRIEVTDHVSTVDACGDSTTPVRTRQVYSGLATIQEYVWCATAEEWTAAREFLYGASFLEPVALVDWSDLGDETAGTEEVLHYVHDRLGSVVALTDAGDPDAQPTPIPPKAVERYEYDPYGQTYVEVWDQSLNGGLGGWASATESKYGNALLWTAQRYDTTTGLYHFPARAYSPRLGRWLQRDPLGYVDGVNLYQYVRSAATTLIDPMGLIPPEGVEWPPPTPWDDDEPTGPPPDPAGPDEPDPCPDDPEPSDGPSSDENGDDGGGGGGSWKPTPGRFEPDYGSLRDYINQARDGDGSSEGSRPESDPDSDDPPNPWNPATHIDRFYRWFYTGDSNAPDEWYRAGVNGLGTALYDDSPLRGGYVRLGVSWGSGSSSGVYGPGGRAGVAVSVSWTLDSGFSIGGGAIMSWGPEDGSSGVGYGVGASWNEDEGHGLSGWVGGSAAGSFTGVNPSGDLVVGGSQGFFGGGVIVDPDRLPTFGE